MLKELLFEEEILEEDAGNLKQIPQAWWKAITGSSTRLGGQDSEIVEIGTDIFKKGKVRGGEAYYHKPKDKANEFMKAIDNALPKLKTYKNYRGDDVIPIAGVFVKIDGQPYALINYQESGRKVSEKYSVVYHTGDKETQATSVSNRGRFNSTYDRGVLTHEELGGTLPDGKCDVYLVMTDANRVEKVAARAITKTNRVAKAPKANQRSKEVWDKDKSLKDLEVRSEKKMIEKRIGGALDIAKSKLEVSVNELQNQIQTAFKNAMTGDRSSISASALLKELEKDIQTINSLLYSVSSIMEKGRMKDSYNAHKTSYEYRNLKSSIDTFKDRLENKESSRY